MSMQTKIAFKVDEINRKAKEQHTNDEVDDKAIIKAQIEEEVKEENMEDDEKEEQEEEEEEQDVNPYFQEPLYIGNLSTSSSTERYYRFILFVSTSEEKIHSSRSIASVTYILHPTFPDPKRTKTKAPFFLDISGWGIFQIDVIIRFKSGFIRSTIETSYMICMDSPISITCIQDGSRKYHKTYLNIEEFKGFKKFNQNNDNNNGKKNFVKKVKNRLKRNLLRTPAPVYFNEFNLAADQLKKILKDTKIFNLQIPEIIYDIIVQFATFGSSLYNVMANQEVYIEDCTSCNVVITAPKFNHLRLRKCNKMKVKFPYVLSKVECIDCNDIEIICTGICFTYRVDNCNNVKIQVLDTGTRITFFAFDSPIVNLKCVGIQWTANDNDDDNKEEIDYNDTDKYPTTLSYQVPYEKPDGQRWSVRWRGNRNNPGYTKKLFHAKYTLGTTSTTST